MNFFAGGVPLRCFAVLEIRGSWAGDFTAFLYIRKQQAKWECFQGIPVYHIPISFCCFHLFVSYVFFISDRFKV